MKLSRMEAPSMLTWVLKAWHHIIMRHGLKCKPSDEVLGEHEELMRCTKLLMWENILTERKTYTG
jgi:hypothetical protein